MKIAQLWGFYGIFALSIGLTGCSSPSLGQPSSSPDVPCSAPMSDQVPYTTTAPMSFEQPESEQSESEQPDNLALLQESWTTYQQRFIQPDGRVIDRQINNRTVSEGQAYAMLRAVLINDRQTFDRTLNWAETNLRRRDPQGNVTDQLWAWQWGKAASGRWQILDANFASDADVDAITALILASRRWQQPQYLDLARRKLIDLWALSIATVDQNRYLMPGPTAAFWKSPDALILNPSYLAPAAFRLFAQVDGRDWSSLINSSYQVLEGSSAVSQVSLPSDWIILNLLTKEFRSLPPNHKLKSQYSFDAFRVWWRIAQDADWFGEPRAERYLRQHTGYLRQMWQLQRNLPARIGLNGRALANYDTTLHYAMLYPALRSIDPPLAHDLRQEVMSRYHTGLWDSDTAYYTQNLVWFGLLPATPPDFLLRSNCTENPSSTPSSPVT